MTVYTLLHREKQAIPVHDSRFDVRALVALAKTLCSGHPLPGEKIIHKLPSGTFLKKII
jgi:myosin-crossreactive antigen